MLSESTIARRAWYRAAWLTLGWTAGLFFAWILGAAALDGLNYLSALVSGEAGIWKPKMRVEMFHLGAMFTALAFPFIVAATTFFALRSGTERQWHQAEYARAALILLAVALAAAGTYFSYSQGADAPTGIRPPIGFKLDP